MNNANANESSFQQNNLRMELERESTFILHLHSINQPIPPSRSNLPPFA